MINKELHDELLRLIDSGNYVATQKVFGELTPYEGNESNLRIALERAPQLDKVTDPESELYQGKDTFVISFFGNFIFIYAKD